MHDPARYERARPDAHEARDDDERLAPPAAARLAEGPLWFAGLLLVLLLIALLLPESAGAQITTGLRPPEPAPAPEVVARAESTIAARRDSAAREQRLDLRAWVDSAASSLERGAAPVTPMPDVPGDSLLPDSSRTPPAPARDTTPARAPARPPARPAPPPTTRFSEGAPAPDTASPLPLLVAVGAGMAGAGVWLRRRD